MASQNRILFEKEGVFIHTTVARLDEDALVAGKIFMLEKPEGLFIEWKALEDEYDVKQGGADTEWAMVDAVTYKSQTSETGAVKLNSKQPQQKKPDRHRYHINFEIADLKSFKRSKPNLGWSYIIFILKCGTTCPALHFHQGGTKAFMKELEHFLTIKKSSTDSCLYLVREHDPQALSKSFDELQLFENQTGDVISKFIRDPYTTTLGGFSKVTKFLQDALLVPEPPTRPQEEVAAILNEEIEGMDIDNQEEPGFEVVTKNELPERPEVKRSSPLTAQQWSQHMDQDGKVTDVDKIKDHIFRGGLDPTIRNEVWKFLLEYYSWDSTYKMRTEQRKKKVDDYFRMKLQWKSVTEDQEKRFSYMRDRKNLIDKDVTRTDRTHQFYQGEENPNIQVLYDILMTYCMYNFDLGYVQGMSDLLAPILVIMENEVDTFWCFAGFMELMAHNFEMTQEGMKRQLNEIHMLVKFIDPQLSNYLESHESGNMYFCFRWVLIMFKREFSFQDIMRLWEVLWTTRPCPNFHLLICLAILDMEKNTLIENNFGFTEILKHINDMSGTIDVEEVLRIAEGIYLQLQQCKMLPTTIRDLLGLSQEGATANGTLNGEFSRDSTPSTPDRGKMALPVKSRSMQFAGQKDTTSGHSSDNFVTPDDNSIEILAEQADPFL